MKKVKFNCQFYISALIIVFVFMLNLGCKPELSPAQVIANECIEAHGGVNYDKLKIGFDFRDKNYTIEKDGDKFIYERIGKDSLGNEIKDVFNNSGLVRFIAGKKVELPDSMVAKYKNSINSVVYFTLLPKPLNDEAVNIDLIGESSIGADKYHKLKVTFKEENGGKDHDDVYIYWINKLTKTMDYFAYSYKVDGGGIRFREAINSQKIGGVRFQDYINYAPTDSSYSLENLYKAFTEGKLQEFSRIENLNLKVN
jgi:hypothetical protein